MALKLENINNLISDDLASRNENWTEIDQRIDSVEKDISTPYTYYPNPPKLTSDIKTLARFTDATLGGIIPYWASGNDIMGSREGFTGHPVYSGDGGQTWFRPAVGGLFNQFVWMMVAKNPATGQKAMLIADLSGGVYRVHRSTNFTTTNNASFQLVFTAESGQFTHRYGISNRNGVICVTSYGTMNAVNPPRHLYISRDLGATWKTVEVESVGNMIDSGDFHVHDVEYDPYSDRIWVSNGDRANTSLRYSDDDGDSWTKVFEYGDQNAIQPTNIIALPDRILFGSDSRPNGFHVYVKNPSENKEVVTPDKIKHLYTPDTVALTMSGVKNVANVSQATYDDMIAQYPYEIYTIFETSGDLDFPVRIILTGDGRRFFEVWKATDLGSDFANTTVSKIIGPFNHFDGTKKIYLQCYRVQQGNFTLEFECLNLILVGSGV